MEVVHVLVTGGAGFIGSHLVDRLLERGDTVWVIDDLSTGTWANLARWEDEERLTRIRADVAEGLFAPLALAEDQGARIEGIVHLAALVSVVRSVAEPLADVRTNVRGTVQVLEYARNRPVAKVVFASSAAVYGDVSVVPTPETAPTRPLSPYGIDKLTGEHFLHMYSEVHGIPTSALRFFNVYGPRQDPSSPYSGVISIFADRAARGRGLNIYGDGEQTRDFVHVSDVVRALVAALDHRQSTEPTNVGTGRPTTVEALAHAVLDAHGADLPIAHGPPRQGEIRHSVADVSALEERFGVRAETPLATGLRTLLSDSEPAAG